MQLDKARMIEGYDYYDYAEIAFGATETSYTVGTNANAALSGSWPSEGGYPVEAQSTLLYATQDCYVRLLPRWIVVRQNLPTAAPFKMSSGLPLQMRVPAGVYFETKVKWIVLYVQRVDTDGTLYVWAEG